MNLLRFSPVLAAALLLGACVSVPSGPSVMVLPGTGKSFDQFRADDMDCRQFAYSQVGGTDANQLASESAVKSAAVGTVLPYRPFSQVKPIQQRCKSSCALRS